MKGYALFQKGKDRPIRICLEYEEDRFVDVLVFATKKGLNEATRDIDYDEEVRQVEIMV